MNAYAEMLADLESHRLTVELFPAPTQTHENHFVRVATDKNPLWYRNLCSLHASRRESKCGKFKTKIKRASIISALSSLSEGKPTKSNYSEELIKISENYENSFSALNSAKLSTLKLYGNF
jgi:hypothetical protein